MAGAIISYNAMASDVMYSSVDVVDRLMSPELTNDPYYAAQVILYTFGGMGLVLGSIFWYCDRVNKRFRQCGSRVTTLPEPEHLRFAKRTYRLHRFDKVRAYQSVMAQMRKNGE